MTTQAGLLFDPAAPATEQAAAPAAAIAEAAAPAVTAASKPKTNSGTVFTTEQKAIFDKYYQDIDQIRAKFIEMGHEYPDSTNQRLCNRRHGNFNTSMKTVETYHYVSDEEAEATSAEEVSALERTISEKTVAMNQCRTDAKRIKLGDAISKLESKLELATKNIGLGSGCTEPPFIFTTEDIGALRDLYVIGMTEVEYAQAAGETFRTIVANRNAQQQITVGECYLFFDHIRISCQMTGTVVSKSRARVIPDVDPNVKSLLQL